MVVETVLIEGGAGGWKRHKGLNCDGKNKIKFYKKQSVLGSLFATLFCCIAYFAVELTKNKVLSLFFFYYVIQIHLNHLKLTHLHQGSYFCLKCESV